MHEKSLFPSVFHVVSQHVKQSHCPLRRATSLNTEMQFTTFQSQIWRCQIPVYLPSLILAQTTCHWLQLCLHQSSFTIPISAYQRVIAGIEGDEVKVNQVESN